MVVSWWCQKPRWQCFTGCQLNVSETTVTVFHRLSAERVRNHGDSVSQVVSWTCQKLRWQCFRLSAEGFRNHGDSVSQVVSWRCQKPRWQCFTACQLNVSETTVTVFHRLSAERFRNYSDSVFHRLSAERVTTTVTVFHGLSVGCVRNYGDSVSLVVSWTCQKLRWQCFPGCQLQEEGRLFPHSDNINSKNQKESKISKNNGLKTDRVGNQKECFTGRAIQQIEYGIRKSVFYGTTTYSTDRIENQEKRI